jgi:hypothetical protein
MRHFKFALLVIVLLAAIPLLFYAQIKHESTPQDQKEEVLEGKRNQALSCGENYISVLTVSVAH